jgi:hypothetical protein
MTPTLFDNPFDSVVRQKRLLLAFTAAIYLIKSHDSWEEKRAFILRIEEVDAPFVQLINIIMDEMKRMAVTI